MQNGHAKKSKQQSHSLKNNRREEHKLQEMKINREKWIDMAGGGGKMINLYVCKTNPDKLNGHKFTNKIILFYIMKEM